MSATPALIASALAEGLMPWPATALWQALLYTIIFGILGILLVAFGFKVFDWLLPKVDVEVELAERQNLGGSRSGGAGCRSGAWDQVR